LSVRYEGYHRNKLATQIRIKLQTALVSVLNMIFLLESRMRILYKTTSCFLYKKKVRCLLGNITVIMTILDDFNFITLSFSLLEHTYPMRRLTYLNVHVDVKLNTLRHTYHYYTFMSGNAVHCSNDVLQSFFPSSLNR
jgi:hypothetical protein